MFFGLLGERVQHDKNVKYMFGSSPSNPKNPKDPQANAATPDSKKGKGAGKDKKGSKDKKGYNDQKGSKDQKVRVVSWDQDVHTIILELKGKMRSVTIAVQRVTPSQNAQCTRPKTDKRGEGNGNNNVPSKASPTYNCLQLFHFMCYTCVWLPCVIEQPRGIDAIWLKL
eukprot:6457497-Amphidinium_carterae.1